VEPRQRLRRADPHRGRHPVNIRPLARYLRPPRPGRRSPSVAMSAPGTPNPDGSGSGSDGQEDDEYNIDTCTLWTLKNIGRQYAPLMEEKRLALHIGRFRNRKHGLPLVAFSITDRLTGFMHWRKRFYEHEHFLTRAGPHLVVTRRDASLSVHTGIRATVARVDRMRAEITRVLQDERLVTIRNFDLGACAWKQGTRVYKLIRWWHTRPGHSFHNPNGLHRRTNLWGFMSPAGNLLAWCMLDIDILDGPIVYLRSISIDFYEVLEPLKGQGVGQAAFAMLRPRLEAVGARQIDLHSTEAAVQFWTKMGFQAPLADRPDDLVLKLSHSDSEAESQSANAPESQSDNEPESQSDSEAESQSDSD